MTRQISRVQFLIDFFKATPYSLKYNFLIYSALLISGIIFYWCILNSYFLSDDMLYIWKLFHEGFFHSWTNGFFRPLIVFSYQLDLSLWKFNPCGYHVTNIFFHASNAFLVFQLCRIFLRLFAVNTNHSGWLCFLSALLFLAMPNHTEAVTWIAGRNDLLVTFFMLLSLIAYCHYLLKPKSILLTAMLLSFAAALLSKEIAMIFPGYIIILGIAMLWSNKANRKKLVAIGTAPLSVLLVLGAYFILRYQASGQFFGGYDTEYHLNIFNLNTLRSLTATIWRSFIPTLPYTHFAFITSPVFIIPFSLSLLGILTLFFRRLLASAKSETVFFLYLLFCLLLAWLPAATLPIALFSSTNERYIYFPTVFVSMGLPFFISRLTGPAKRTWIIISLSFILGSAVLLQTINQRWIIAGEQSQAIHQTLGTLSHKKVYFLNLPDNYQGAYMFHVAYPPTMLFFHKLITDPAVINYFSNEKETSQLHRNYAALQTLHKSHDYKKWQRISTHYQKALQSKDGMKWQILQTDIKQISETETFKHNQYLYQKTHEIKDRGDYELFQTVLLKYNQSLQTPELKQWQALNQVSLQIQKSSFFKQLEEWNKKRIQLTQTGLIQKWDDLQDAYYTTLLSTGDEPSTPITPDQIHILSRFDLLDLSDRVTITQTPDNLTLHLENPQAHFQQLTGTPEITITQNSLQKITIHFPDGIPKDADFLYYSESKMHKLVIKQ
ncbi:hypothetical protein K8S19_04575 [bacterium]|nr:hypothetical protein [bacterium]